MRIRIGDDGKGLALDAIREKALKLGILNDPMATPGELAECIFQAGFSTASSLTLTSGRGVGMDAVRTVLQNIGGTVQATLFDQQSPAAWALDIHLPQIAIIPARSCSIQKQSA